MLAEYHRRRDKIVAGLRAIPGIKCHMPAGSVLRLSQRRRVPEEGWHRRCDPALAEKLLDEANVALVPGPAFGTEEHVRISYATSLEQIDEGLRRLKDFFARL